MEVKISLSCIIPLECLHRRNRPISDIRTVSSYYNLRKDTCRQSRTHMQAVSDAFPFTNYSAGFQPIVTKLGTDNLSGSERKLTVSEF